MGPLVLSRRSAPAASVARAFILMAVTLICSSTCRADEAASIADLQQRLDAVEQQNSQLLHALESGQFLRAGETPGVATSMEVPAEVPVYETSNSEYFAPDAAASSSSDPFRLTASWKNGLELESANKAFRVHVGGRTQFDIGWYDADEQMEFGPGGTGAFQDGVDFRRARFRIEGTMYECVDWAAEYDFANTFRDNSGSTFIAPAITDLWMTLTHLPYVGNLRIGNSKPPIGFEHLVSSRFLPFNERSYNQDAFNGQFDNGFSPGVMLFNQVYEEQATWWLGLFKPTNNPFAFNTGDGEWSVVGRLTALAWYEDEGRQLLHLGVSGKHADLDEGTIRFRTRNSIRSGSIPSWPILADTRNNNIDITGDDNNTINGELAAVCGSWTFQSEYLSTYVTDASQNAIQDVGTLEYHGGYVQVLYYLTGEHDNYNKKTAVFDRVIPNQNFLPCGDCKPGGIGAWQVGVRYSHLDLNDKAIDGGKLDDLTVGLNWFLNPNMKIQTNYAATHRDSATKLSDGTVHAVGMRFAQDF